MQKSLDSIMSSSLKAAFGKSKAASESKASIGAEASTGASNPFSNLLERVMQKNQPKIKSAESSEPSKISKKASQNTESKDTKATSTPDSSESTTQANQPKPESTKSEDVSEKTQQTQTSNLDAEPVSDTDQPLWTETLNSPSGDDMPTASNDESPEVDLTTETTESTFISPDMSTNMNLLISLQQPMALGLYQPAAGNSSEAGSTEATSSIETSIPKDEAQPALPSSPLPTLSKLAPLTSANAAFALPLQGMDTLPATTHLSPDLPNADTLPLSQSSDTSSQGLADILDNGQTALPGTTFGTTEMVMQASSTAGPIEISQTITLSNGPVPLEALSGQLEIPTTADVMPLVNDTMPLEQLSQITANLPLQESGLKTDLSTATDANLSGIQSGDNKSAPLELPFASLPEQTETLSQLGNMNIEAPTSEGSAEFETLETELPSVDTGILPDLSQTTANQNMTGASSTSSAADNPIAQFTSTAQTPAEQVAEGTIYSIKQGQRELIIRLNPDNLGEVKINLLRHGDNSLSARLIASTPESHDLLQSQLDSLKQNLESQGIQVERLSVIMAGSVDTQNQSSSSQHHTGQQQADSNTNNQQQASNQQGQPDHNTFAQMAGNPSQQKHGTHHSHRNAFQQQSNISSSLPTDGTPKPENQPRHHANGNISILV